MNKVMGSRSGVAGPLDNGSGVKDSVESRWFEDVGEFGAEPSLCRKMVNILVISNKYIL